MLAMRRALSPLQRGRGIAEHVVETIAWTVHEFFRHVLPGVRGHHERMDGCGYPDGLAADEIPLMARLILIVDTLDAMGSDRSYRKGLPIDVIYKELTKFSGSQFDMHLVKTFLEAHPHWVNEKPDLETLNKVLPGSKTLVAA